MSELERTKYPGMRSTETAVWRAWLRLHEGEFDRYEYNVRLGVARDPGAQYPDNVRKVMMLASQLRIDVVAWKGLAPTIIEVKKSAWPDAVQQVQKYGAVWLLERLGTIAPGLWIITARVMEGTAETAASANVRLITV